MFQHSYSNPSFSEPQSPVLECAVIQHSTCAQTNANKRLRVACVRVCTYYRAGGSAPPSHTNRTFFRSPENSTSRVTDTRVNPTSLSLPK
jgi:hypothetical protein